MRQEILSELVSFLVDEGILDPNTTINGQSSARKQKAIPMVVRWRANDGPTMNAS